MISSGDRGKDKLACHALLAPVSLVLASAACTHHPLHEGAVERHDNTSASVISSAMSDAGVVPNIEAHDATEPLAPLDGYPAQLELLDGKDMLGVVAVPLGAREPRPIMVALHGGSERPERACAAWRAVVDAYAFVVCPHGFGGNERRLGWRNASDSAERIARAVTATKKAFGIRVKDTSSIVLAGFSMGGSQVALLGDRDPHTYRRLAIGDTAHDPRPALTFSKVWSGGGGERVVFFCTTSGCEPSMRAAARAVEHQNGHARLNIAPTQKHALSERVVQSIRRDWPWLVEGAEGWESYTQAVGTSLPGKTETFGAQESN